MDREFFTRETYRVQPVLFYRSWWTMQSMDDWDKCMKTEMANVSTIGLKVPTQEKRG